MVIDSAALSEQLNLLNLNGNAFIEYATLRPQEIGQVVETIDFRPDERRSLDCYWRRVLPTVFS